MKVGLVLEGGAMRGLFTAGILDTFLDENIHIDGIIGVSAGALFGANYFSKQKGRALRYNKKFCKNPRFMGFLSFLLTGNIVNKQFAFYDLSLKHDVFDFEEFKKNDTGFYLTVTNIKTGEAEYLRLNDDKNETLEIFRATSALPFLSKTVKVKDQHYLDGGVADSIPVMKCKEMGYDKIIVVLTQPLDFIKQPLSEKLMKLVEIKYWRYPKFVQAMKNRHFFYNQTIELIKELENKQEIFVIRPSRKLNVGTIERNPDNLQSVYDLGVQNCLDVLEDLKQYLQA